MVLFHRFENGWLESGWMADLVVGPKVGLNLMELRVEAKLPPLASPGHGRER
jgi:hypothetical protein